LILFSTFIVVVQGKSIKIIKHVPFEFIFSPPQCSDWLSSWLWLSSSLSYSKTRVFQQNEYFVHIIITRENNPIRLGKLSAFDVIVYNVRRLRQDNYTSNADLLRKFWTPRREMVRLRPPHFSLGRWVPFVTFAISLANSSFKDIHTSYALAEEYLSKVLAPKYRDDHFIAWGFATV
jgi:hypothetical protein